MTAKAPTFTIANHELKGHLTHLRGLTAQLPPTLAFCLVRLTPAKATLYATNLSEALLFDSDADVDEPGELLLPTQKVLDITRELPDQARLTISETQPGFVDITADKVPTRYHIPVLAASDYPAMPDGDQSDWHTLPTPQLLGLIRSVAFAIASPSNSHDERSALRGLYLHTQDSEPQRLVAVATDGRRLAHAFTVPEQNGTPLEADDIIPRAATSLLLTVLKDQPRTEFATIRRPTGGHCLAFRQPGTTAYIELLAGEFPNYRPLVDGANGFTYKVEIDREDLLGAVRRVSRMTASDHTGIDFTFDPQGTLRVSTDHDGGAAEDVVPATCLTPLDAAHTLRIRSDYVLDGIRHLLSGPVQIHFNSALAAVHFTTDDAPDSLYVVMPMRL